MLIHSTSAMIARAVENYRFSSRMGSKASTLGDNRELMLDRKYELIIGLQLIGAQKATWSCWSSRNFSRPGMVRWGEIE